MRLTICLLLLVLALPLLASETIQDYQIVRTADGKILSHTEWVTACSAYSTVFFGELHDDILLHQLELSFLQAFYQQNPTMAISFEMFESDNQQSLSAYLQGKMDEEAMRQQVRLWTNYDTDYRPLLQFAKENKLPVIAANIPRWIANKVSRYGLSYLDSLQTTDRAWAAKQPVVLSDGYKDRFMETMAEMAHSPMGKRPGMLDNIYAAQCLKDDTMAERIASFLTAYPQTKLLHFNGDFHSKEHLGTVQKLQRLLPKQKIAVITPAVVDSGQVLRYDPSWKSWGDFVIVMHRYPAIEEEIAPVQNKTMPQAQLQIKKHHIKMEIEPNIHFMQATDQLRCNRQITTIDTIYFSSRITVRDVTDNGKQIPFEVKPISSKVHSLTIQQNSISDSLRITYQAFLKTTPEPNGFPFGVINNTKHMGTYLPPESWYPYTGQTPAQFSVWAKVPYSMRFISSGAEQVQQTDSKKLLYHWESDYAYRGMLLYGYNVVTKSKQSGAVRFSVFYPTELMDQADAILTRLTTYQQDYTKIFGAFPASSYSVVYNFLPEIVSAPGLLLVPANVAQDNGMLLSPSVLGHEFCRAWWGNAVYCDESQGNWADILNHYSADYYQLELYGSPSDPAMWRRNASQEVNMLHASDIYPLRQFTAASSKTDAVIGYQRGAMFIHYIQDSVGKNNFYRSLRDIAKQYKGSYLSWGELQQKWQDLLMPEDSKLPWQDLNAVFTQWLDRSDYPSLQLQNVNTENGKIHFVIEQKNGPFSLNIPIRIFTEKGIINGLCPLRKAQESFSFPVQGAVSRIEIDPDYAVLKHLDSEDLPYNLRRTFMDNPLLVLPDKGKQNADLYTLQDVMQGNGIPADVIQADKIDTVDWQNRSLLVLGTWANNSFFAKIAATLPNSFGLSEQGIVVPKNEYKEKEASLLFSCASPWNQQHSLSFWFWNSDKAVNSVRNLFYYTADSWSILKADSKNQKPLIRGLLTAQEKSVLRWEAP